MPGDHTLLESFELDGFWGPPSRREEERIPGRLRFDPERGIQLELLGCFEDSGKESSNVWPYYESLLGVTKDLGKVTLLRCNGTDTALRVTLDGSPFGTVGYRARFLVVGEHLPKESEMRYDSVVASYHNLEGFIGLRGFASNVTENTHTLSYKHPDPIKFSFGNFNITADYMLRSSWEHFRYELRQHGELTASVDGKTNLEEFLRGPLTAFRYLNQLSLGHRIPLTSLEGQSERLSVTVDGKTHQQRTQIFFTQSHVSPLPTIEHPFNMMFTLRGLGSEISTYLDRWYRAFESFRDVLDLYFSLDPGADTDVVLEYHFLSAVLAVEGYHRAAGYEQKTLTDDEYTKAVSQARATVSPKYLDWLNSKLQHNDKSLSARLKELYDEQPDKVRTVLGGRKDFCDTIVATRNSLAHTLSQRKGNVLGGLPLWLAIKQLRLLLQTFFLRQMGLPGPILESCIDKSPDYRTLLFHRGAGK